MRIKKIILGFNIEIFMLALFSLCLAVTTLKRAESLEKAIKEQNDTIEAPLFFKVDMDNSKSVVVMKGVGFVRNEKCRSLFESKMRDELKLYIEYTLPKSGVTEEYKEQVLEHMKESMSGMASNINIDALVISPVLERISFLSSVESKQKALTEKHQRIANPIEPQNNKNQSQ